MSLLSGVSAFVRWKWAGRAGWNERGFSRSLRQSGELFEVAHDVARLKEHGEGARLLEAHGTGADDDCRHVRPSMGLIRLSREQCDLASGLIERLQEVSSSGSGHDRV